ncbi:hypothetical protein ACHAXN_004660 [Cyclotella atomus]
MSVLVTILGTSRVLPPKNSVLTTLYVNPDGRRKAEEQPNTTWRKNVNPGTGNSCSDSKIGVDINRNFDFMWGNTNGASTSPCASDYMGRSKQSEPETKALSEYAKSIFPEGHRKYDPEGQMNEAFGEDIMGLYMDIHAYGGYTYYPWGHKDSKGPDNDSLQWVRSLGWWTARLSICVSSRPNSLAKGPDIFDLGAVVDGRSLTVTASASDSQLVNIPGYPNFSTGDQTVASILFSLGIHPDETEAKMVKMTNTGSGFEGTLSLDGVSPGKRIVYAQAKDITGSSQSSPTPSPTNDGASHWSEIAREDFKNGFGGFEKRGRSVRLMSKAMKRQGVVRIRHGSLLTNLEASSHSKLRVRFSAFFLAEADEICLEQKVAESWNKVECWSGGDLDNGRWHDGLGTDIAVDVTELSIRLRSSSVKTRVFIDKVSILAKS